MRKQNEAPELIGYYFKLSLGVLNDFCLLCIFYIFLFFTAVLAPKDPESAHSVAQALQPYNLPIGVFSSSSAQALLDQGVTGFISTAPFLNDYGQTLAELVQLLGNSNLVIFLNFL